MTNLPAIELLGDSAFTVVFGQTITEATFAQVSALATALTDSPLVAELVPTFAALTIHYDPLSTDPEVLRGAIAEALARPLPAAQSQGRSLSVPVCFEADCAPDLPAVALATGLAPQQVIDTLCATPFQVYMLGFLPGFPYMGGLPKALALPRRSEPRLAVPARSLAIAGEMCAIYPTQSPGGWHLLGRTPWTLFDPTNSPPARFQSGDRVRLTAINHPTYQALCAEAGLDDS